MAERDFEAQLDELASLMKGKKTVVIAGAGLSTDAGIPDYRGTGSGDRPSVEFDDFVADPVWQRWVWMRNQQTWRTMETLSPTPGHQALAQLEKAGLVSAVATQNVDGLDARAGIQNLYELHGSFNRVRCLKCGQYFSRDVVDKELRRLNPDLKPDLDPKHVAILAEADRAAAEADAKDFVLAPCTICGGLLKPDVIFFGEQLPMDAMENSFAAAAAADVVLTVGSSLMVMTGMMVLREGAMRGAKVAIINRGRCQGDPFADVRIEGGASEALTGLAERLVGQHEKPAAAR